MSETRRRRVGQYRLARRVVSEPASKGFEVGREFGDEWLVQGRAGGSDLLSTDGKLPDQALMTEPRSADMRSRRVYVRR